MLDVALGPRLYGRFDRGANFVRAENTIEWIGEGMMSVLRGVRGATSVFSPIIVMYLLTRAALSGPSSLAPWAGSAYSLGRIAALALTSAYISRFIGRLMDPEYAEFITIWRRAVNGEDAAKRELKRFDYVLDGCPVDFVATANAALWYLPEERPSWNPLVRAAGYTAVHSFGISVLYPGATGALCLLLGPTLREQRNIFFGQKGARRAVLRSTAGDNIDTMYKEGQGSNSKTLVLCSEGNAGFYEVGIVNTVESRGYSVLGWNHPGFGASTGMPYPAQTLAAAEAVWQYATRVLGYKEENIIIYGWSIGGYPSSWLAANHPKIQGMLLDATFDDLLPLAEQKMPSIVSTIVRSAVREHLNLDIQAQLARYSGPVRLIRRLQEEILITDNDGTEDEKRASNRANFLLRRLLEQRHPEIMDGLGHAIDAWLAMTPSERTMAKGVSLSASDKEIRASRIFKLCEHYITDYDATHVQPLPAMLFVPPEALPAHSML